MELKIYFLNEKNERKMHFSIKFICKISYILSPSFTRYFLYSLFYLNLVLLLRLKKFIGLCYNYFYIVNQKLQASQSIIHWYHNLNHLRILQGDFAGIKQSNNWKKYIVHLEDHNYEAKCEQPYLYQYFNFFFHRTPLA